MAIIFYGCQKNEGVKLSCRREDLSRTEVAGYCWGWNSKKNPDEMDIAIPEHDFAKQWNLANVGMLWLFKRIL